MPDHLKRTVGVQRLAHQPFHKLKTLRASLSAVFLLQSLTGQWEEFCEVPIWMVLGNHHKLKDSCSRRLEA